MEGKSSTQVLSLMTDDAILEEAARRLQSQYTSENGQAFLYGSFRFIFHDGRFQGVEDWPRKKRYLSPERLSKRGS